MSGIIHNPILRGFHPDPCICKARGKYYLITSTFEWLPGVSLYESDDLVNWKSKGGILRNLNLEGIPDSAGIWAPALSYADGMFYLIYTISKQIDGYFKDVENYVVTARDIDGPWSEPTFVNASGFDPSMYHENGKHYVLNPMWDSRPIVGHTKFNGLVLQEFDFEKGMTGEAKVVYKGSGWGSAEGPHIMKKDGYYYILAAEGGTGRHHSICVSRARNIWGPYEVSPFTPMITAWEQDTILKKSGHGNLVETDHGQWYLVHLCGRYLDNKDVCVLGRETSIQQIKWIDDWPVLADETVVPRVDVNAPDGFDGEEHRRTKYYIDFQNQSGEITREMENDEWLSLRTPMDIKKAVDTSGIYLKGGASLTSTFSQSMLARRIESFASEVETCVNFRPYHYSQTAGLTCFYNTKAFYYLYVGFDEKKGKRIISILSNDNFEFREPLEGKYVYVSDYVTDIRLKMKIFDGEIQFMYALDNNEFQDIGPKLDLSILSDEHVSGWTYTGTVAGITAVDTFNKDSGAVFKNYSQISY